MQIIFIQKPQVKILSHDNYFRDLLLRLQRHRYFERFILVMINLNTLVLCAKWAGQTAETAAIIGWLNLIFIVVFTLEMIIKVIALGISVYFREKWNRFDFAVVILTYIFIAIS